MKTVFVKALFDLDCDWEGLPPVYRIYVDDELFAERTWRWTEHRLTEILQIDAVPGNYTVRIESVLPSLAKFNTQKHRVTHGPAKWIDQHTLEINNES